MTQPELEQQIVASCSRELFHYTCLYMANNGVTAKYLSDKAGISTKQVGELLFKGEFPGRLSHLVRLSLAIGRVPKMDFRELSINEEE